MDRSRLRSQGKRLVVWLVAAGVVALAVALVYFGTPLRGTEAGDGAGGEPTDELVSALLDRLCDPAPRVGHEAHRSLLRWASVSPNSDRARLCAAPGSSRQWSVHGMVAQLARRNNEELS